VVASSFVPPAFSAQASADAQEAALALQPEAALRAAAAVLPGDEVPVVPPEADWSAVLPEDEAPVVPLAADSSAVLPEDEAPVEPPADELPVVLPVVLPEADSSAVLRADGSSAG
jgi:hypothetical protein